MIESMCCVSSSMHSAASNQPRSLGMWDPLQSCLLQLHWAVRVRKSWCLAVMSFCRSGLIVVCIFAGRCLCIALGQTQSAQWAGSLCNRPSLGRGPSWVGHTTQWHLAVAHLWLSSLVNKDEWEVFPLRVEKLERLMYLLFLHGSEMQITGLVHTAFPLCLLFLSSLCTVIWLSFCNSLFPPSMVLAANPPL